MSTITAATQLTEANLIELRQLVYRVRAQRADMQRSTMLSSRLLMENTMALNWFVRHANDSWQVDGEQFFYLLRDKAGQIADYVAGDLTFFAARPGREDQTRFVYEAGIWTLWSRNLKENASAATREALDDYLMNYLIPQSRRLMRTGVITHKIVKDVKLPVGSLLDEEGFLYSAYGDLTSMRERLAQVDRMTGADRLLFNFDRNRDLHFREYWLPKFISEGELAATQEMSIEVLRELYADIYLNGPRILQDAHHARVWQEIIY